MPLDFTLNGGPVNVAGAVQARHTPFTPGREPTAR